jgi:hypothetical protein
LLCISAIRAVSDNHNDWRTPMRKTLLAATILTTLAAGGIVAAQAPAAKVDEHASHHPAKPAGAEPAPAVKPGDAPGAKAGSTMGGGMMGGGMMAGGACPMMGHGAGMGGGTGPGMGQGMMAGMMGGMLGGAGTKVEVKKIDKGVTMTLTSADAPTVARLQKMAEAMRLMHEATTQ